MKGHLRHLFFLNLSKHSLGRIWFFKKTVLEKGFLLPARFKAFFCYRYLPDEGRHAMMKANDS